MMGLEKRYLRTLSVTPPGGWKFQDPDTGFEMSADNFNTLVQKVETHRTYKGSNMGNYPDYIEHQICNSIPESWSQKEPRKKI